MRGTLAIRATIRMKTVVLALMTRMVALAGGEAVGQLGRVGRGRAAGKWAVTCHRGRHEVIPGAGAPSTTALAWMWRRNVGHLMRLVVRILDHLLISPLCRQLRISLLVVGILEMHLSLGRMAVHRVGLLVVILVERGVILLWVGMRRGPSSLLLLDRIRVGLLRCWRRRCSMIVGRRGPLAGNGVVDSVRRRVHLQISGWMPVLGSENGHGQKRMKIM